MAPPDDSAPLPDGSPSPGGPPPGEGYLVPRTTYVWLALLLLVYLLPSLLPIAPRRVSARRGDVLSAAAFEKYVAAEYQVRSAFGLSAFQGLGGPQLDRGRTQALRGAVREYRALLEDTASPNIARRILILEHALGRRFDTRLVAEELEPALRGAGKGDAEIAAERRLWRDLYQRERVAPEQAADYERRLRAMELHFLGDRALYDLYTAAGDARRAESFVWRLESRARAFLFRVALLGLLVTLGFFGGAAFLVLFLVSAAKRRWRQVGRVATRPQRLGWGDLLDAFLLYLLLVRGVGLLVAAVAIRRMTTPPPHAELALSAAVQIGTGAAAALYLWAKARRRGATLADVGLTTRGALWANIGYGIAGYCATLPLVLVLRGVAQLLFRHFPNTAPNPIMPLLVAEREIAGRVVIFVMVAVAAPFLEELFFRGALFGGLRSRWGWVPSAVAASAVFAVAHPPQDWLPIFGLGLGLATMREMRQSLVPCMVAHLVQNSFAFFFLSTLFDGT